MAETNLGRYSGLVPKAKGTTTPTAQAVSKNRYEDLIPANKKATSEQTTKDLGRYGSLVPAKEPEPVKKTGIVKNTLKKVTEFVAGAAEAPSYTKGTKGEILKNLPNEIVRTILPGAAAINDNPEEFAKGNISNKDLIKELPKAGFETVIAPIGSFGLTAYGAASKYINPKLGLPQAPGVGEDGAVNIKTPLGDITNVQERIAKEPAPVSNFGTAVSAIKHTSFELLNGLYTASLGAKLVNPRIVPVTPKGAVNTKGYYPPEAPAKSGQLYQPQTYKGKIDPQVFNKIVTENNIPVSVSYNPKYPIFFQASKVQASGQATGQFFQIKPSYLSSFKGNPATVPNTQKVIVGQIESVTTPAVVPPATVVAPKSPVITPTDAPIQPPAPQSPAVPVSEPLVEKPQETVNIKPQTNLGRYSVLVPKETTPETVPVTESPKEIQKVESQISAVYKEAPKEKVEQGISEILAELELSQAGFRTRDMEGNVKAVPSTFPAWVPEELRSKNLFSKVLKNLESGTFNFPTANRSKQRELYDVLIGELDARVGVNTSELRKQIINLYENNNKGKVAEVNSGSPARSKRGDDITVDDVFGAETKRTTRKDPTEGLNYHEKIAYYEKNPQPIDDFIADYRKSHEYLSHTGFSFYVDVNAYTKNVDKEKAIAEYKTRYPNEGDEAPKKKPQKEVVKKTVANKPKQAVAKKEIAFDSNVAEMSKGQLKKAGIAAEALGFEEHANVLKIDGKPAVGFTFMDDGALGGFSVAEQFRNQGVARKVLTDWAKENGGTLRVADPNSDMLAVLKKIGKVSEPNGEGTVTLTLKDTALDKKIGGTSGNATIGKFRDGTPVEIQTDKVKPIELPEMVQLAKDLMGSTPQIRNKVSRHFGGQALGVFVGKGDGEIRLRADLFDPKVNSIDQAAKTLAHEIGHLIDYLPNHTLARGNLLGRLATLREFMKEFYAPAGVTRLNVDLKEELWNFSKYWKPIDEAAVSPSFLKYRKSGKEVYADFISGLFNDPVKVGEIAPASYNAFFELLDRKPLVKEAYFELQALLHGERESIIKVRREGVQTMFKEGDMKSIDFEKRLELERADRKKNSMAAIKFNLVDNNTPMIDRVKALEKKGVFINMDEDPRYLLEERNYLSGLIKAEIEKNIVPIYDELKANEISWNTFGEALFYDRIVAGDRSAQANPRGITPDAAKELYDDLKKEAGDKWPVIEKNMVAFRGWMKSIATEAYKEGLYTPEMYEQMQANPAYVTFRVIEHIEDGVNSKVYKSIGTLKDITNPADASILKTIATIRSIQRNKTVKTSVDFLNEHYPTDIEVAKSSFNGKAMQFKESKDRNKELVVFKRGGKAEGYYVDPYIKHSLENDTIGRNTAIMKLISPISFMNRTLFRPLFIGYNPGFQAFNLVRDFSRFWKNMPNMSLARAFGRYIQAMPVAKVRAFGISENPTQLGLKAQKMMEDLEAAKVFGTTFTEYAIGKDTEETQIELILRNSGIDSFAPEAKNTAMNKLLTPFVKTLELIQKTGNFIETLPKAAGVYQLTGGDVSKLTAEQRSFIRKNIGSPDFLTRGYASPMTNDIFLFSNSIIQGMRSDINIATSPKSRSGYWWKTAKMTLLPKILMFMASIGLMGAGTKDLMDNASEYDKANYTIVPLGKDTTGKVVYIRIPQDESGRFIGALLWKTLGAFDSTKPKQEAGKQLSEIFSFLGGQIPSITPTVSTVSDISTYLSGRNPYDSFRGRLVLSDDVFKANNWETDKAFIGYVFNQIGGGIFYRFNSSGIPSVKGPLEEALNLPLVSNIPGRFVRVSDYGVTETLNVVKAKEEQARSREVLENRKLVDKYVEQALAVENLDYTKRRELELALVEEKFNGKPKTAEEIEKANNLIKKLRVGLVRGISGPEVDSLTSATSNAMKLELLKAIQARMSEEEFTSLKQTVIREKIVSSEVFMKLKNEN